MIAIPWYFAASGEMDKFGLIYTGSDDGLVQITKNNGASWQVISNTLPKNLWVSRVVASKHKKERVYVALNGYRWDDFSVYVYLSDDYGKTWKNINSNISKLTQKQLKDRVSWAFAKIMYLSVDAINNISKVGKDAGIGYLLIEGLKSITS